MCIFIDRYNRDLLKDTHTDGIKSTSDHVGRLVFLFSCPKHPSINHLNFYCIKQIDYIFPCVMPTVTPLNFVLCRTFLSFTRCNVICDLLQYTHTHKNVIYLLNITWIAEILFSLPISQQQYLAHSIQAI